MIPGKPAEAKMVHKIHSILTASGIKRFMLSHWRFDLISDSVAATVPAEPNVALLFARRIYP